MNVSSMTQSINVPQAQSKPAIQSKSSASGMAPSSNSAYMDKTSFSQMAMDLANNSNSTPVMNNISSQTSLQSMLMKNILSAYNG